MIFTFFTLVGVYSALCYFYENLKSPIEILANYLKSCMCVTKNEKLKNKYGEWAVVTGASDGIGKYIAIELAQKGMNIVLISHIEKDLIKVAREIQNDYSVDAKYIVTDFRNGKDVYNELKKQLLSLDIGILVNNVGIFHEFPNNFDLISEELIWNLLLININAATMMTRTIIPQMKNKRRGLIVNVSSGTDNQPVPLETIYSASKAYIKFFTLGLQKELKKYKVNVQLISPMYVRTKMNNFSTSIYEKNSLIADVELYARSAVFTFGKTSQTSGYWIHGLQIAIMKLAPQSMRTFFSYRLMRKYRREYYDQQQKLL